ncbi:MAG: hypothetical protein M3R00_09030, partial [Pseudomonadota bacterium]|nr:hypothetical protein [Pseudomonadota bacterium]
LQTPLHIICKTFLERKIAVVDIQTIIELFIEKQANLNLCDNQGATPLLCVAEHWPSQGASFVNLHTTLERFKERGAIMDVKDNSNRNLLHYFVALWVGNIKKETDEILLWLFNLAPNLDVNVAVNRVSPIHSICRDWLGKDVSLSIIQKTIEFLIIKKLNLNVIDDQGDTPIHIIVKTWLKQSVSPQDLLAMLKYCLENGAEVNAVDAKGRSILHYVFEWWEWNKDCKENRSAFIELMRTHKANFNLADSAGFTPVAVLLANRSCGQDYLANTLLPQLEACGTDFNDEHCPEKTLVYIAAMHCSTLVFDILLAKFTSGQKLISSVATMDFDESLLHCIALNRDSKMLCLYPRLLADNIPLDLKERVAQKFWINLRKCDGLALFHDKVMENGNIAQLKDLAHFYLASKKMEEKARATSVYEMILVRLFAEPEYRFSVKYLPLMQEIIDSLNFPEEFFEALNELCKISSVAPLREFLSDRTLEDVVVVAAMVCARHFPTEIAKSFEDFKLAHRQLPPNPSAFRQIFHHAAFRDIEKLAEGKEGLNEARLYLIPYYCSQHNLEKAEACYHALSVKSAAMKKCVGEMCFEMGKAEYAISRYQCLRALASRADNGNDIVMRIKDYCQLLWWARDDVVMQREAINGLIHDFPALSVENLGAMITHIIESLIPVIGRKEKYDTGALTGLLQTYGIERLFSSNACENPNQGYLGWAWSAVKSKVAVYYTPAYAEAFISLATDGLYGSFKKSVAERTATAEAIAMIEAHGNEASPLPGHVLSEKLSGRILELRMILSQPKVENKEDVVEEGPKHN